MQISRVEVSCTINTGCPVPLEDGWLIATESPGLGCTVDL